MSDYLRDLWLTVRARPLYALLTGAVVLGFTASGLSGYRLLGDDNETDATELVGGPRTGGHVGAARFYHK